MYPSGRREEIANLLITGSNPVMLSWKAEQWMISETKLITYHSLFIIQIRSAWFNGKIPDFHSGDVGSIPTVDSKSAMWRSGQAQLSYKEKVGSSNLSIASIWLSVVCCPFR